MVKKPDSAREVAAAVLRRVIDDGAFSQMALHAALDRCGLEMRDRAFVSRLVYETLTRLGTIDSELNARLPKGLRSLPPEIRSRLRVATAQILSPALSTPGWAARHEALKATTEGRLRSLVDGVLRRVEEGPLTRPAADADAVTRLAWHQGVPPWIGRMMLEKLGEDDAFDAMEAFNGVTPVQLRVRGGTSEEVRASLTEDGIETESHAIVPSALVSAGGHVAATKAFASGVVTIQDAGAQLVSHMLPATLSGNILDVCAGLGGKSIHLADRFGGSKVVSVDRDLRKLLRIREVAGCEDVAVLRWDLPAAPPELVVERGPYAAVVLDAPCSALGTLGRHPEVRWNRLPAVVGEIAATQRAMLDAVAPLVAPGGWLVYVVCTFTPQETTQQVAAFLARHPDFTVSAPDAASASAEVEWGTLVDDVGGITLWPHRHQTDGFYLTRLRRAG